VQPCDSLSLRELPALVPLRSHLRRLVVNGNPTDIVVWGDELTRQYHCGARYLLITNYDHFEAVTHWFYLLGSDGRVIDQASTPDYFGFFEKESIEASQELSFGFYGTNDRWRLRVMESGQWSFAWFNLRLRVNRFLLRKRFLHFERSVGEPWQRE
jgi:hypothetical protein